MMDWDKIAHVRIHARAAEAHIVELEAQLAALRATQETPPGLVTLVQLLQIAHDTLDYEGQHEVIQALLQWTPSAPLVPQAGEQMVPALMIDCTCQLITGGAIARSPYCPMHGSLAVPPVAQAIPQYDLPAEAATMLRENYDALIDADAVVAPAPVAQDNTGIDDLELTARNRLLAWTPAPSVVAEPDDDEPPFMDYSLENALLLKEEADGDDAPVVAETARLSPAAEALLPAALARHGVKPTEAEIHARARAVVAEPSLQAEEMPSLETGALLKGEAGI